MTAQVFETVLKWDERRRLYIDIPFAPEQVWGSQPQHYVSGRLNDSAFHAALGVQDGSYFMPVNKALRGKANLNVGDTVQVTMKRAKPPATEIPPELAQALEANPAAQAFFEALSAFQRNTYTGWVAEAEDDEARNQRTESAIQDLLAGQKQPS
jgi:hypothetical protein